jgi:hypothetical protein
MYPRWHILLGAVFTLLIYILVPGINLIYLFLIFFSSFLIDFDHYLCAVYKTKKLRPRHAFDYYKKRSIDEKNDISQGIKRKGDFHLFHTIEFHLLIGLFSFVWPVLFYLFLGMIFHSLLDVTHLISRGAFHRREFFFFRWLGNKF